MKLQLVLLISAMAQAASVPVVIPEGTRIRVRAVEHTVIEPVILSGAVVIEAGANVSVRSSGNHKSQFIPETVECADGTVLKLRETYPPQPATMFEVYTAETSRPVQGTLIQFQPIDHKRTEDFKAVRWFINKEAALLDDAFDGFSSKISGIGVFLLLFGAMHRWKESRQRTAR